MSYEMLLYEIACSFPALKLKGVHQGGIPGIEADEMDDSKLSDFLYKGSGAALSHGEILILEFLLNLMDPYIHTGFNLGVAMNVLGPKHMRALIDGIVRFYNRR